MIFFKTSQVVIRSMKMMLIPSINTMYRCIHLKSFLIVDNEAH